MATVGDTVRIAAMSDVHYNKGSAGSLTAVFRQADEQADVLLLCGDLTDFGLPEEVRLLAKDLTTSLSIPVVAVLGNHDYESGQEAELTSILADAGIHMLDGDSVELHGIGFAGIRGFCGGFGRGALGAWGESIIKQFVHEAVQESLKLESALARLRTEQRVALIHYAPIRETVEGEPLEIYPFLGSSRLEEPLARYSVSAVFHGHAHKGQPEGRTTGGIPVYNVSLPLMKEAYPEKPPFRLLELPRKRPDGHPDEISERRHGGRRAGDRVA